MATASNMSVSDPLHYPASAHARLRCSEFILRTLEKLRGRTISEADRILDVGCGLRVITDPLWVTPESGLFYRAGYVLGLDVDYRSMIAKQVAEPSSRWKLWTGWPGSSPREFVSAPVLDWEPPQEGDKFDVVYSGSSFHWIVHDDDDDRLTAGGCGGTKKGELLFRSLASAINDDGYLVAHFPGCENFYPVYTRIILAALGMISEHLILHSDPSVQALAQLPKINRVPEIDVHDDGRFAPYWEFRRGKVAFWDSYGSLRANFSGSGLRERMLFRGVDWELVDIDKFYSAWASAGKSVFFGRFQTKHESAANSESCALYERFEEAFRSVLETLKVSAQMNWRAIKAGGRAPNADESLGVKCIVHDDRVYIQHYCHRFYLILQKSGIPHVPRMSASSLSSLPIKISHDISSVPAPELHWGRDERAKKQDALKTSWALPFTSCLSVTSAMIYGVYYRTKGWGATGNDVDRRSLLCRGKVEELWQFRILDALERGASIASLTNLGG